MGEIVVAEDMDGRRTALDARDHRGVVLLVRKDLPVGQAAQDGGEARLVGDEPRAEQQGGLLAVQRSQLRLQLIMQGRCAANVARASRTGAQRLQGIPRAADRHRVDAHPEVVVRGPDGHVPQLAALEDGVDGKAFRLTAERRELAIAPLRADLGELGTAVIEKGVHSYVS
jgi:hypothetical protein